MAFRLSSFLSGAVEGAVDILEEDQTNAAKSASLGVKSMKENYDKVMAENRTLETELSKNVRFLKENDSTATEAQLFAAATNKVYMTAAMEAAKTNPGSFRVADVVKIKEANPSTQTALEMIKAYTTIPAISQAARQAEGVAEKPQGLFGIGALRDRVSSRAASKAEEQTAKAMGVSIEQLRAASGFKRPEIKTDAEFDYTSLQDLEAIKKNIQKEAFNVSDSGDKDKINNVMIKAARVVAAESLFNTNKKTEAEIQTDLVNEIQEKQKNKDPVGASLAATLLAQRKALLAAPSKGDKTDADKISQSNLIQVATRTRVATIEQELPPGTLITSIDAQGNVTTMVRELEQGGLFRRGDAIAANAIIKEMTKPDGMPRSEMHKNAMMSVGIRFDEAGKAIKPPIPELPSKGGTSKPPPPAAATPAAASAPAPRGATTPRAAPAAQAASNKMPAPKTQAEYDAIPPDIEYMDTDGQIKRKGGK